MKAYGGVAIQLHLSSPRHFIEVGGQLQALAALHRGTEPLILFGWGTGWAPESV
jgi:hypothetical protein